MKNLYKRLRNSAIIGLTAIAVIGCEKNEKHDNTLLKREVEKAPYFDNWGFIEKPSHTRYNIELGDFDGDGDLDIAVTSDYNGIRIYENRIPQKNK